MKFQLNLIFSLTFFIAFILFGQVSGDDPDIDITTIKYTNDFENGESVNIVPSGKNVSTEYNFRIFDDDDDFPDGWEESSFDDSEWDVGSAPFGNKANDDVEPGTIWQSEHTSGSDGDNDYIIIRKNFTIEDTSAVLGGKIKSAYTNYYAVYLNGQQIQNCLSYSGGCYEGEAEYWNKDISINVNILTEGNNTLVLVGRDSLWNGGDNTTWLDCELDLKVQSWKENLIVLGDDLVLGIDFFNNEESNVTNLDVTLEIEGTEFANKTIEIENNKTFEWRVEWTPDRLGEFNVTAKVLNESLTRFIHVGYYAYNFSVDDDYNVGNTSELLTYNITISNEGDVDDNYTFQIFGTYSAWDVDFVPSVINLAPGETGTVILEITPDNDTYSGIYELTLTARSQYHGEIENMIVQSGRDNETEWKWVNSTGGRLYEESNTTWTEIDFVPGSNWTLSPAPFGDDDLSGIDYNTEWSGNNYAYFRHIFYIDDLSSYENDTLSLNMAANNYGTYYLNGEEIFDDLGWGSGHYAEYWNEEIKFNSSILKEGKNVLASVVRETGNTQWFDEELITVTPKSSAWGFQPEYLSLKLEVLPVYAFEIVTPIEDKAVSEDEACCDQDWTYKFEIWLYNRGNIEDTYEISIELNDTTNFSIIDFDSTIHANFEEEVTIGLNISLNSSITKYSIGEFKITVISKNSTESIQREATIYARLYIPEDLLSPATYAVTPELINNSTFEINWHVENWYRDNLEFGNDTKYVIIQYSTDNGTGGNWTEWEIWGNFTSDTNSTLFTGAKGDHQYRFRSIGGDDDGNIENKEDKIDCETFVDLSPPNINIRKITSSSGVDIQNNATNTKSIDLFWDAEDNNVLIVGFDFYYKYENSSWIQGSVGFTQKTTTFYAENDGYYQFKIIGHDVADNKGFDITNVILVDTVGPNITITGVPSLTDAENIVLNLEELEDIQNFTIFYKLNREGESNANLEWQEYGIYVSENYSLLPIDIAVQNQYEYQFKVLGFDSVGNYGEGVANTLIDRDIPSKIRNLQLSQGKTVVNSTTDILISFMSSQSQDLIEYRIYRSESANDTGELLVEIPYGEQYLSYKDSNIKMGEIYHYSVVAVDRMSFESEQEKGFIDLTIEEEIIIKEDEEVNSNISNIFIGLGIIGGTAAVIAFVSRKSTEEITQVMADLSENIDEEKFSEMDGELVCNACGGMFDPTETSCPSCGTLKE